MGAVKTDIALLGYWSLPKGSSATVSMSGAVHVVRSTVAGSLAGTRPSSHSGTA
jgi:hypothetical protein